MKAIKCVWTGVRPLLLHNGLLADHLNPYAMAMREITLKRTKKTDADHAELARLEWLGSLYLGPDKKTIVIPSENIERCIQLGAQKSRLGKDVQAAVWCSEPEVEVKHDLLRGKSLDDLFNDKQQRFTLRTGVKVNKNRVIRVRPMIPTNWTLTFDLEYEETILSEKDLRRAIQDASAVIGLGDWRPRYGRFLSEVTS